MSQTPPERSDRFEDLLEVVRLLRDPDGCPWDRAQTHASLRQYLLEESHEALEAIDRRDDRAIAEELGDLLVHIAFHADIASRAGEWTPSELIGRTVLKLVRRHPHVFDDAPKPGSAADVIGQWEALKTAERGARAVVDGVPLSLPALSLAAALQRKAEAVGIKPEPSGPAIAPERLAEVAGSGDEHEKERLAGEILGEAVAELRAAGVDAETALRSVAGRFRNRLRIAERSAGRPLGDLAENERSRIWAEARG